MIYITGDTHADWMSRLNTRAFPEQKDMTKKDYVIILGDFGIWNNSREQKYDLDWLDAKNFTTLFIDGNHENYDILDNIPIKRFNRIPAQYVRPSVIHLMRGQIYKINDIKFFIFGGARSHDIKDGILDPTDKDFRYTKNKLDKLGQTQYRIDHQTWWEREMPSKNEYELGLKKLRDHRYQVDFILTHTPYSSLIKQINGTYETNILTDYLEEIKNKTDYKKWFFGHMHINRDFKSENAIGLYEQIIRIY